ncbi:MAG TPA: hypothetical protein VFG51_00430 [Candidatus Saccharimonadia bacterium]|nr:hypothetical protein [Candidatus Saccharimonadia bacterium]
MTGIDGIFGSGAEVDAAGMSGIAGVGAVGVVIGGIDGSGAIGAGADGIGIGDGVLGTELGTELGIDGVDGVDPGVCGISIAIPPILFLAIVP